MAEKWARIWIIPEGRSQGTIVSADSPGSLHGQKTRGYEVTYEVKRSSCCRCARGAVTDLGRIMGKIPANPCFFSWHGWLENVPGCSLLARSMDAQLPV